MAELLGVPLRTAQRWAADGRMPDVYAWKLALVTTGDLELLFPGWRGCRLRPDCFITDDGSPVTLAQIRALPFLVMALKESQRLVHGYRMAGAPRQIIDPPAVPQRLGADLRVIELQSVKPTELKEYS